MRLSTISFLTIVSLLFVSGCGDDEVPVIDQNQIAATTTGTNTTTGTATTPAQNVPATTTPAPATPNATPAPAASTPAPAQNTPAPAQSTPAPATPATTTPAPAATPPAQTPAAPPSNTNNQLAVEGQTAQQMVSATNSINKYLAYVPKGYNAQSSTKWPLVIFLHGQGEKGDNLNSVKNTALPRMAANAANNFQFLLISPQLRNNSGNWMAADLDKLLAEVKTKYNVDPERIILTGLSLGGGGAWDWALRSPQHFSAVVTIAGWGNPPLACALKNTPVWVFHGAKDNTVPILGNTNMVNALKACGGKVQFTIYPDLGHDSWTITYNNPEVIKWMLAQRKRINA